MQGMYEQMGHTGKGDAICHDYKWRGHTQLRDSQTARAKEILNSSHDGKRLSIRPYHSKGLVL